MWQLHPLRNCQFVLNYGTTLLVKGHAYEIHQRCARVQNITIFGASRDPVETWFPADRILQQNGFAGHIAGNRVFTRVWQ
jgi:hypothetical protein